MNNMNMIIMKGEPVGNAVSAISAIREGRKCAAERSVNVAWP